MSIAYADLKPGDRIAAVNGHPLAYGPVTVEAVFPGSVRVAPPRPSSVEWRFYEDAQTIDGLLQPVEPEPAAPKPSRPASRTVEGVRLTSQGGQHWASADGSVFVQREDGHTFCDAEHPMRLTPSLIEWAQSNTADSTAHDILWAARAGKRGYICGGGAEHLYDVWTVMGPDGWTDDVGESFTDALGILATALRAHHR